MKNTEGSAKRQGGEQPPTSVQVQHKIKKETEVSQQLINFVLYYAKTIN